MNAVNAIFGVLFWVAMTTSITCAAAGDPLPSWNDGAAKSAITTFVEKATTEGGKDFVPAAERIATFDNDGTLWCEQPMYFQMMFAFDRIRATAGKHPEWKDKEPFKSVLAGNLQEFGATGQRGCGIHAALDS